MRHFLEYVRRFLSGFGRAFEYAVLLRVPLSLAAGLGFFPLLASPGGSLTAYLFAMYDLKPWDTVFTGAAVAFYWLALSVCSCTVLATASRFDPPPLADWFTRPAWFEIQRGVLGLAILYLIPAGVFLRGVVKNSPDSSGGWGMLIAGIVAALLAGGVIALIHFRFDFIEAIPRALLFWTRWTPSGFRVGDVSGGALREAHEFAGGMAVVFLIFYALLGWRGAAADFELPTLASLLLILTTLCWLLSGVAYLFDRWRAPLLMVLVLLALVGARQDHVFPLLPWKEAPRPPQRTARQMIELGKARGGTIVVATSGGGILASAWTATVLSELSKEQKFLERLQLVSAVSGGSVGTMYFAHAMRRSGGRRIDNPATLVEEASRSSLGAVAWGAAYPDLYRVVLPRLSKYTVAQEVDRAWALRKAWTRGNQALREARLSDWEAGENLPALIFNATVSETGERFLFANYRPASNGKPVAARKIFYEQFPGNDIEVVTAAGNSAAFPYVSPVAQAKGARPERSYHLADGGYYDNFGVASALDFLLDAFRGPSPERVLAILIEAGPGSEFQDSPVEEQRLAFQFTAPPLGLLRMWQIAARARNFSQLDEWAKQVLPNLEVIRFVYKDSDAPTSWHLNEAQRGKIAGQWTRDPTNASARACVQSWLRDAACAK